MTAHIEVELKLALAPEQAARLARLPVLKLRASGRARSRQVVSVYFDTPDEELKRQGVSLRLRKFGARWLQTIKTAGESHAGLHRRAEWEAPLQNSELDFDSIARSPMAKFFAGHKLRKALRPVFTTDFSRASRILQFAEGESLECCLDRGEIRAGRARLPLCEIELELKSGRPALLYEFALALHEHLPLRLETRSKAERGYALFEKTGNAPRKARAFELTPGMTASDAFKRILEECLAHVLGNEEGFIAGADPEFLHQMRVGARRLRSGLGMFAKAVPPAQFAWIREEIRWLNSALGPARDWDVFTAEILFPAVAAIGAAELKAFARAASRLCKEKNLAARAAVGSQRYQRFCLRFGSWLVESSWAGGLGESSLGILMRPAGEFARRLLAREHRRLLRAGENLAQLDESGRHKLRIAAKKMRYAGEFLASLYPRKATRNYLRALGLLQDILGQLNDLATSARLLAELRPRVKEADWGRAAAHVQGWTACAAHERIARLEAPWKIFLEVEPFWKIR